MIINKKLRSNNFISKIYDYINKFIKFLGVSVFLLIIVITIYFFVSGLSVSYSPKSLFFKVNDKVFDRYLGFDFKKTKDYLNIIKLNILSNFQTSELENIYLEINQKSILGLELQRKLRSENGGELPQSSKATYPAKINYKGENVSVKIRTKGVRKIHWMDKDKTSYKIDIRGEKRLWGLEEFSLQKPITRNYTYEYIFHELLGYVNLTNIKYFFVNLFFNDQNLGVYAVEESFSKELIERDKKRNGPIFGLREELGEYYPNVNYELYSENYWINQHPEFTSNLFSILNNIKEGNAHINDYYDLDKWAKYFAIMDLTGAYHGSLSKSVKAYYNPTTGLFEPIGYDLHQGAGIFDNFILLDFLQETKPNCSYICYHKDWFFKFFKDSNNELNYKFIKLYLKYLKNYSEANFLTAFLNKFDEKINNFNQAIYKDNSKSDKVKWIGFGYYVYDENYLLNRANLIRGRINSIKLEDIIISKENGFLYFEDYQSNNFPVTGNTIDCEAQKDKKEIFFAGKMKIKWNNSCKKIKFTDNKNNNIILDVINNVSLTTKKIINNKNNFIDLRLNSKIDKISEFEFYINKELNLNKNYIIKKDNKFILEKGITIKINKNSTLLVEGSLEFLNDKNNFTKISSDDGTGSIIFVNNEFNFKNILFENLYKPNLTNYILYGGVNFINSKIKLDNIRIRNSNNEDAINIINSNSEISNFYFENIAADALDVDFGFMNFKNIKCLSIKNDCIDISGARIIGEKIYVESAFDKGISIGENSDVEIKDINLSKNKIGVAVKDGSIVNLKNLDLRENTYDIALFNKKNEFKKPKLIVKKFKDLNEKKILQSKNTTLIINGKAMNGRMNDDYINSLIY